jgi:ATP-dependent Lon protease
MREVILPRENQKDLNEIPEYIKKGIAFRLVDTMDDVARLVFDEKG